MQDPFRGEKAIRRGASGGEPQWFPSRRKSDLCSEAFRQLGTEVIALYPLHGGVCTDDWSDSSDVVWRNHPLSRPFRLSAPII